MVAVADRTAAADWRTWGCAVRLVVTDPERLPRCESLLRDWLDTVDAACSRFRPDAELRALDDSAGRPVQVSPVLAEALAAALHAAELTGGLVDPTVGRALERLGYDRDFSLMTGDDGSPLRFEVRPVPGWRTVRFDPQRSTVAVPEGVRLDLGATAKAWAADRAAAVLSADAGCGVLVALGGDTAVAGPPPQGGWRIRVQDRTDECAPEAPHAVVTVHDGGLATSGTAARRWARGGRQLHHLIDPRTGQSSDTPWRTVSVAAGTCLDANTAATAALIRGAEAPAWLVSAGLPARLVAEDGGVTAVAGWPAEGDRPGGAA
jgi:thiamine biosynthesis lipoprotein